MRIAKLVINDPSGDEFELKSFTDNSETPDRYNRMQMAGEETNSAAPSHLREEVFIH